MDMLVNKDHIREYLVQQDPFVMVDSVLEYSETGITTGFTPDEHNIFSVNSRFTAPGIIEHMAQSAAAKAGYETRVRGIAPVVGFIGAVKNLKVCVEPPVGSFLTTRLKITNSIMNVSIASIEVFCGNDPVASCEMKIFLDTEEKASWS